MKKKHGVWRFIYKSHRYIGLFSALILIMLSITGIALNHTEDLKLDSQMIQAETILDWYGIKAPENLLTFNTQHHSLSQLGKHIYFDQQSLIKNQHPLIGAVETEDFIVLALSQSLLLISLDGEIIEQNNFKNIEKIGLDTQQNIIVQSDGKLSYSDDGLISWQSTTDKTVNWSQTTDTPKNIKQAILQHFSSNILPLERVLLDIHSGRFFGLFGVIIVDICGVLLILLALSGCAIWLKHKLRFLKRS